MTITTGSFPAALMGGGSNGSNGSSRSTKNKKTNGDDTMAKIRRQPTERAYKQAADQDMCAHCAPGVDLAHCHYTGRTIL